MRNILSGRCLFSRLILATLLYRCLAGPALAQDQTNTPISLYEAQLWLGQQPDYAESIDSLYTTLGNTLQQPPPRGMLAAPFHTLAEDPAALQPVLHDTLAALPRWHDEGPAVPALLESWARFYPLPACTPEPLALPQSLDGAVAQIESAAAAVVKTFQATLTAGQAEFVRNNHAQIMGLLQPYPFGGAFADDNLETLVSYLDILDGADLAGMFCAGRLWARFLEPSWRNTLLSLMTDHPRAGEAVIARYQTPYGLVFFGGDATYTLLGGNILFIADSGGDDIYGLRTRDAWSGLPQLIMDFAGNDTYDSLEPGGYAAGIGSIGLLLDLAGDDTYHANAQTQGFGMLGIGLLHDMAGDDEYNAGAMAQGFALYGAGMVLDDAGNDRYQVTGLGQGAGMTGGIGILADRAGDDYYLASGLVPTSYGTPGLSDSWSQGIGVGIRFTGPGGIGILQDGNGTDTYTAGSFSQGGGYYLGLGMFQDNGTGDDNYLGSRYNFGWGAHMGVGYFREAGGNDHYRTRQIVAAGLSWDLSLVLFEDRGGDDIYEMGDFSLSASDYRSMGLFHDFSGSDTYLRVLPARAGSAPPNLSLFIDSGQGENRFEPQQGGAGCRHNSQFGFVLVLPPHTDLDELECGTEE